MRALVALKSSMERERSAVPAMTLDTSSCQKRMPATRCTGHVIPFTRASGQTPEPRFGLRDAKPFIETLHRKPEKHELKAAANASAISTFAGGVSEGGGDNAHKNKDPHPPNRI